MSHLALVLAAVAGFAAALIPVGLGLSHELREHRSRAAR